MRLALALVVVSTAAVAAVLLSRRTPAAAAEPEPAPASSFGFAPPTEANPLQSFFYSVEDLVSDWKKRAAPYASVIREAERQYNLPQDLLLRLGYQESRYRDDIISGKVRSSAGAVGMFQFLSGTAKDMGVNLSDGDWRDDAYGAAKYLSQNYSRFRNWEWAVAAYNGGPGNISYYLKNGNWPKRDSTGKVIGTKARPQENINYVAQIGADVALV